MAAPGSKTLHTLDGEWAMNKKLSESIDEVLRLQGLPYFARAAIKLASPSYTIRQSVFPSEDPDSKQETVTCVETVQRLSGIAETTDVRILDDKVLDEKTMFWGKTTKQHGWAQVNEFENEYLREGWLFDGKDSKLMVTYTENKDKGWKGTQVTGFRLVNDERYYCVRILVEKEEKSAVAQLVYDYVC
ncbi:unnamed protein product [Clonostachys chloroleuca]|uniref:Uncharacterized protein n=1 Tax=Clonostachys chloroleuca TaxID=1926264 RepID=A0AA35LZG1_9HYPO|nr:unnamed protein product [Clonostachys chloroleuca]